MCNLACLSWVINNLLFLLTIVGLTAISIYFMVNMMKKTLIRLSVLACFAYWADANAAPLVDNFTKQAAQLGWVPLGDACLTAGDGTGTIPACQNTSTLPAYGGTDGGNTGTIPDAVGVGALRLTDDKADRTGAVLYPNTFPSSQGLRVTFTSYMYNGLISPFNNTGADGIGFYLLDAGTTASPIAAPTKVGAFGGSLGYSCANYKSQPDGIANAYLGIGIDAYQNFTNGARVGDPTADNTSTGGGPSLNTISVRGAGNVNANWLQTKYSGLYPNPTASDVQNVCKTGKLSDGLVVPNYDWISSAKLPILTQPLSSLSYKNAVKVSTAGDKRPNAAPVTYKLEISPAGLMSMQYAYNGGAWTSLPGLDPALPYDLSAGGTKTVPDNFRFGFGASTGSGYNIHELTCFAASSLASDTSAASNTTQGQQLRSDTQLYIAAFDSSSWVGHLSSYSLVDPGGTGNISVSNTANWDANCVLTGGTCVDSNGNTIASATQTAAQRNIISWSGTAGIPFKWASLTAAQQAKLVGTSPAVTGQDVLDYVSGIRTNEVKKTGTVITGTLRTRAGMLGDIVDSSPALVEAPDRSYSDAWADAINGAATIPENATGAETYGTYLTNNASRLSVVYAGANDGILHGFRTGSYSGTTYDNTTNDGQEVLAFVPNTVYANLPKLTNPVYNHEYFVDGSPSSTDLFYNNVWHTWLVSGLGGGGKAVFALDVSDPANFPKTTDTAGAIATKASAIVKGEWDTTTLTNLGNLYGTPQIRRMHNGQWAIIFGNGYGSVAGKGGIYIMPINSSSGAIGTPIFLDTGAGSLVTPNGISYVEPTDLDDDNIIDYIYAGDLLGNVWRFDVTSSTSSTWAVSKYGKAVATPLINVGKPITTKPLVVLYDNSPNTRALISFGTGQYTPIGNTTPATYVSGAQSMYGVWDYDMAAWNTVAAHKYLTAVAPQTINTTNLQTQTIVSIGTDLVGLTSNAVTWCPSGTATLLCNATSKAMGWTVNLSPLDSTVTNSQVVYNPFFAGGAIVNNVATPPSGNVKSCNANLPLGWTLGFNPLTGGAFANAFIADSTGNFLSGTIASVVYVAMGAKTGAVGIGSEVRTANKTAIVSGGTSGIGTGVNIYPNASISGKRLTWRELR